MNTNATLRNLGEKIQRGLTSTQHFLKKQLTGKNRKYGIIAAVITGVLIVSLATFAVPPSAWLTLTSNNCLTQGAGNTMVEAPGPGNRNYLYVLFGNSSNSFKRFDPLGISGGTGDCESTSLANAPSGITSGASMVKVGENMIYVYPGSTNSNTLIYFINEDLWVSGITGKANDSDSSPPIGTYSSTSAQGDGNAITNVGTDVYVTNGNSSTALAKYTPSTNTWTNISTSGQPTFNIGTTMTSVGTDLYVLAGYKNFKKLDTTSNTWTTLSDTPAIIGPGAAIVYPGSGDYLYATKGNNNNTFWKYCFQTSGASVADPTTECTDAQANSWSGTASVATPASTPNLISSGGTLIYPGSGDYLYGFQGNDTKNFLRYCLPGAGSCTPNTWSTRAQTPTPIAAGASIISDRGTTYLYATRGNNSKDFLRYNIGSDSWESMPGAPVKIGTTYASNTQYSYGGLAYVCPTGAPCPETGTIYMTSGNSYITSNGEYPLFRFPLSGTNAGKWPVYSAIPGSSSGVGSSLAYPGVSAEDPDGDFLYHLWGNNSNGFDKFSLSRSELIPWNRSKLDYVNPISSITESDTLINHPNTASNYLQGTGNVITEANGKLFIINGHSSYGNKFSSFDPVKNIWTDLTNSPLNAYTGATMVKKDDQNLYVIPGNSTSNFLRYYIPTDDWIPFNRAVTDNGNPIAQYSLNQGNGNAMTEANGKFYVINGTNNYMESYDPSSNTWTTVAQIAPYTPTIPNESPSITITPGNGAAMVTVGTDIYVLPGSTTSDYNLYLLKYDTITNIWSQKASIPAGNPQAKVGPGTSLAYTGGRIYAFKGNGSQQFFSYTIASNTWSSVGALASTPAPIGGGASLMALGTDLYAFSGNNTRNFWRYNIGSNTWTILANTPGGISSGGSLTTDGTNLYATAGNYTKTFYKYTISSDTWSQLEDTPSRVGYNCGNLNPCTVSKGSISYYDNNGYDEIWMVSGNGTLGVTSTGSDDGGSIFRYTITNADSDNNNTWPIYKKPAALPTTITSSGTSFANPGTGDLLYLLRGGSTTDFWSYDTVNNSWNAAPKGKMDDGTPISQSNYDSTGATATQGRGNTMVEANNELYTVGGGPSSSLPPGTSQYSFQKFSPANNTWTNLANVPGAIFDGASLTTRDSNGDTITDTIYLFRGNSSTDFWRYDIPTDTWFTFNIATKDDGTPIKQVDSMSSASSQGDGNKVIALNGKLYVATGNTSTVQFEKYDPATNAWTALPSPLIVGSGITSVNLTSSTAFTKDGNYIYAIANTSASTSYLEKFDTTTETWSYIATTPAQFLAGAGIAYFGEVDGTTSNDTDFIFATRGGNTTTAYRYCLQNTGSGCTVGEWTTLTSTPSNIYGGGGMTPMVIGGIPYIFVIAGGGLAPTSNTTFFQWNIQNASNGSWGLLAGNQPPDSIASGGAITNDGTYIYVTRGASGVVATRSVWRYDSSAISGSRWSTLSNVPAKMGANNTTTSRGGITYCSSCGTGEIWAVTGNGHNGFSTGDADTGGILFRYRISDDTWPYTERTRPAPGLISAGAALNYPGTGDFIYGFRGAMDSKFWSYDVTMNEWNAFSRSKLDTGKPLSQPSAQDTSGTSEVAQGAGNSILEANGKFYILEGNSQINFFEYNPSTNKWINLAPTPSTNLSYGASMTGVDNNTDGIIDDIYVLKGGGTTTFWKYNIVTNAWTPSSGTGSLAVTPAAITYGGSITYPGSGDYLYATNGNGTGFYKYCFRATVSGAATTTQCSTNTPSNQANSWSGSNSVATPATITGSMLGGSALVSVGGDIYALRGGAATSDFYKYTVSSNTWSTLTSPTWTSTGQVKSGGALTTDGTNIYATKGNANPDIRKCTLSGGDCTWSSLTNLPVNMGSASTTTAAGGIAYISGGPSGGAELYAVTGNGSAGNQTNGTGWIYRHPFTGTNANTWPINTITPDIGYGIYGGTSMAADDTGNLIYAIIGQTNNLSVFNIATNTWSSLATAPNSFVYGASLVKANASTLYATRGYGTTDISRYNIPNNRWDNASDAPVGASTPPASAPVFVGNYNGPSGALAYVPVGPSGSGELWLSSGNGYTGDSAYKAGLLYRHPFTGSNANTWPVTTTITQTPSAASSGGTALVGITANTLLAFPGGSTALWSYNIPNNRWNNAGDGGTPTALPAGVTTGAGASLTTDGSGTTAWATRGNTTSEIYRLDYNTVTPSSSTWTPQSGAGSLANFGYNIYGGGMAYSNNSLWEVTGRGTSNFTDVPSSPGSTTDLIYRYDIANNTWPTLYEAADATVSPATATFESGSSLASTPDGLNIFALRGTSSAPTTANSNMWKYAVSGTGKGSWTALPNMPDNTSPFRIKSGGSLVASDDSTLYATKGNAETGFYRFDYNSGTPANSTWTAKGPLPVAIGQSSSSTEQGELVFSSEYGSIFATSGNDTSSPFSLYSYPLIRATITCITATADASDCAGSPITPTAGEPFSIVVQAVDQANTAYNVGNDTNISISLKTGNGVLGGTTSGTITSGNSSVIIAGLTYSIADGGIVLSAIDSTSPANITTLSTSDSDPFTIDPANPDATSIATNPATTPASGPTGGRTGVTISGTSFYSYYSRPITITSPETLTNYQVKVTVDTSKLIVAGKMKSDCSDAMFTDIAPSKPYSATPGGNQLTHWIESGCNTQETGFWVKTNSLASGSNTIYMSYGDFRVTSTSNGDDTFVFFDDFTGNTLDTGKWLLTNPYNAVSIVDKLILANVSGPNGIHSIVDGTDGDNDGNSDFDRANGQVLEYDLIHPTSTCGTMAAGWKDTTSTLGLYSASIGSGGFIHAINGFCYGTSNTSSDIYENGTSSNSDNTQNLNKNQDYKIRITMRPAADGNGAIYERSLDGGKTWITWKTTTGRTDATGKIAFSSYGQAAEIDNVRIRKYSATEPTSTIGDESPTLSVTFDGNTATIESITPTAITVSTPVHVGIGAVDVVINDAVNHTDTLAGAFTYGSPSITSITPDNDIPDGGTTISIAATFLNPSQFIRPITITNGGGALTDYQVQITIDTATLISEGRLLPDGGDMRFYSDEALTTPLTYFIEGPMNSASTKVWIKVLSIAATPDETTIYMTYGNPALTSESSASTFVNVISNNAGYWPMDEESGTTVSDSSGNSNAGTMNGTNSSTNIVAGELGNARTFNGNNNYISIPTSSSLQTYNGLSVEMWYKIAANQSSQARMLSKNYTATTGFEMIYNYNSPYINKPYMSFNDGSTPYIGTSSGTTTPSLDAWHHIVATFDASTKTAAFYLDGAVQETSSAFAIDTIGPHNTIDLNIGKHADSNSNFFNGTLDEIRLYNRALTSTEVGNLYSNHPFTSTQFPGNIFIRKLPAGNDPEPAASVGTETGRIPVMFDTTFSANVTNASSSLINLIAPDHNPPGAATVPVLITNAGDNATASTNFIYGTPPSITAPVTPNEGSKAGGTEITITGLNFSDIADPDHPCSLP